MHHQDGDERVGMLLAGRYRVAESIGTGGMGMVHAAMDERLRRPVAIKFLQYRNKRLSPDALVRFEREALAAASLGHPNIVQVFDFHQPEADDKDGRPFLVMEHLEGRSLADCLVDGPLEPELAVEIHLQLLAALGEAHGSGVIHRDVKPPNVFIVSDKPSDVRVKLLDFGLAYLLEEQSSPKLTATGITVGTPAYMAPERLMGEGMGPRSDIYSAGVCLYESLSGTLPFKGADLHRRAFLVDPEPLAGIDVDLEEIVNKAMSKFPGARFSGVDEMADALRVWQRSPRAPRTKPKRKKNTSADTLDIRPGDSPLGSETKPAIGRGRRAGALVVALLAAQVLFFGAWLLRDGGAESLPPALPSVTAPQEDEEPATPAPPPEEPEPVEPEPTMTPVVPMVTAPPEATPRTKTIRPTPMRRRRPPAEASPPETPAMAAPSLENTLPEEPVEPDWSRLDR